MWKQFPAALVLGATLAGCAMTPPADLDVRTTRPTRAGRYLVSLQPLAAPVPLNRIHAWEVTVRTPEGTPVTQARIDVGGGMPQHFHGFPTRPRITSELGGGRYRLDGVKFSMTGWWEFKLAVHGAGGADDVTFNTVVTP